MPEAKRRPKTVTVSSAEETSSISSLSDANAAKAGQSDVASHSKNTSAEDGSHVEDEVTRKEYFTVDL